MLPFVVFRVYILPLSITLSVECWANRQPGHVFEVLCATGYTYSCKQRVNRIFTLDVELSVITLLRSGL